MAAFFFSLFRKGVRGVRLQSASGGETLLIKLLALLCVPKRRSVDLNLSIFLTVHFIQSATKGGQISN